MSYQKRTVGGIIAGGAYKNRSSLRHCERVGLDKNGHPVCKQYRTCAAPTGFEPVYMDGALAAYRPPYVKKGRKRGPLPGPLRRGRRDPYWDMPALENIPFSIPVPPNPFVAQAQGPSMNDWYIPPADREEVKRSGSGYYGGRAHSGTARNMAAAARNPWLQYLRILRDHRNVELTLASEFYEKHRSRDNPKVVDIDAAAADYFAATPEVGTRR